MHRLALALSSFVLACGTGVAATGDTGETGDDTAGTTTAGNPDACGEAPNSLLVDGMCWCEPGTTWVEPFNPASFECAPVEPRDGNTCPDYYAWCSSNPENYECCYDPAQDPDGSHDPMPETTTGDASTGDTDATSTGTGDVTSTGTDSSTGADASTGGSSSSSSGEAGSDSSSSSGSSSATG
jgi:hypothetical protein